MKVLLVGSGGREHALAWAILKSIKCDKLFVAPGNAGIAQEAECVNIGVEDIDGLVAFAKEQTIDLVVVGPEGPLVEGLADAVQAAGIKVFGPSAAAAQLEGSKGFMKDLCTKYNIPTAKYGRFTKIEGAEKFIRETGVPIVIKTDGLAAGKGVIIAESVDEAIEAARDMLSGASFGAAGSEVVIEEFMEGEELSYFALADGKTMLPLTSAQDHKRAFDGDEGPNTGGMGAYSPAHFITAELEEKILHQIIKPTIDGMAAESAPFTGVLYAGLMVTRGEPRLIEYNVRFGDPECQPMMMRLQGDLLEILMAGAEGRLDEIMGKVTWASETALCVVMAANGYPGSYEKNTVIKGVTEANETADTVVFHAGTAVGDNGELLSVGGRVLGVTSTALTVAQARDRAYEAVDKIDWPDGFCRRDIAWRALEKEEAA